MADVLSTSQLPATARRNHVRASSSRALEARGCSFAGFGVPPSTGHRSLRSSPREESPGRKAAVAGDDVLLRRSLKRRSPALAAVQMELAFPKTTKWWEKGLRSNMKEISSARDIVDSLKNAGDTLVIVGFFSPGCGGCRALHPKICLFAEANPVIMFLQVNHEELKSMCYSLNVHVLPFFRFYRGAQGRLCSFSCTVATIKKFKDALARHGTERCSLGPTKGLEREELLALSANTELDFTYTSSLEEGHAPDVLAESIPAIISGAPETTRKNESHVTADSLKMRLAESQLLPPDVAPFKG